MSRKMKKLENKIEILKEQSQSKPSEKIDKKIMKLEKKKAKLEKWLKIKLPFRILIKAGVAWLVLGGVCYACSYVPVVREVKMATMGAIAYVAPESVGKVLDVVTLNIGANNSDFEWLKTTLKGYISGDIKIEITDSTGYSYNAYADVDGEHYFIDGIEVSKEEYDIRKEEVENKREEESKKQEEILEDILGTTSTDELSSMTITDLLMKIATNSTSDIISKLLDMSNIAPESRNMVEQDINRALKILKKLNNSQMNEIAEIITNTTSQIMVDAQNKVDETNNQMELEKKKMELINQISEAYQRGDVETAKQLEQELENLK